MKVVKNVITWDKHIKKKKSEVEQYFIMLFYNTD